VKTPLISIALASLLTAAAVLAGCTPSETPQQTRAREIMAAVKAKAPDATFGKVWANGSWTCGRFTSRGAEKGFLGQNVGGLWIEGPDTEPYYGRAWIKFCSASKPALFPA
jgi:hypothetical protein